MAGMARESHEKRSIFASLSQRKKKRSSSVDLGSPVEVRPGIWSTDPTAKVFGFDKLAIPPPDRPKESTRTNSLRSQRSNWSGLANHSPSKHKSMSQGHHKQDSLQDRWEIYRANHGNVNSPDVAKLYRDFIRQGGTRRRMRDSEDYITQRAPNPWTGVITPSVYSDEGRLANSSNGLPNLDLPRRQSTRWKRSANSWYTKPLTPIAQSETTSPRVSHAQTLNANNNMSDKFVFDMPSAQNPSPLNSRQIEEWERQRRRASASGATDPFEPPTPPVITPEPGQVPSRPFGPDSIKKGQTPILIKRKPVGGHPTDSRASEDTVIVNQQAAAAMGNQTGTKPAIRITTPRQTTRNFSSLSDMRSPRQQSFLGKPPQASSDLRMNRDSPYPMIPSHKDMLRSGEARPQRSLDPQAERKSVDSPRMGVRHRQSGEGNFIRSPELPSSQFNNQGSPLRRPSLQMCRSIITTPISIIQTPQHQQFLQHDGTIDPYIMVPPDTGALPYPQSHHLPLPITAPHQSGAGAAPPQPVLESYPAIQHNPQRIRFSDSLQHPISLIPGVMEERRRQTERITRRATEIEDDGPLTPISTSTCLFNPLSTKNIGPSDELGNIWAALATLPGNEAEVLSRGKADIAKTYISTRYPGRLSVPLISARPQKQWSRFAVGFIVTLYAAAALIFLVILGNCFELIIGCCSALANIWRALKNN